MIPRGYEDRRSEGSGAVSFKRNPPPIFHSAAIPGGPTSASPGLLIHRLPLPAPSYRFPLLSCQAPEASLSLKTLGEKNHENLPGRAVPTEPPAPFACSAAFCPQSRQSWESLMPPPLGPQQGDHGVYPRRVTVRVVDSHTGVPLKSIPPRQVTMEICPPR